MPSNRDTGIKWKENAHNADVQGDQFR